MANVFDIFAKKKNIFKSIKEYVTKKFPSFEIFYTLKLDTQTHITIVISSLSPPPPSLNYI